MAGSGDDPQVSTTTTAPANADANNTISALAKGIQSEYTPGKSLYQAPGANTTAGQSAALTAASNPLYSGAVNSAIGSFGNTAAGNDFGTNDPGYAALRAKLGNDVLTQTNQAFNNSGLFGSDSNQKAAASGLTDSLGALDYQNYQSDIARQQQAAGMLPGLFQAAQAPSSVQQGVGAAQDADAAAKANGSTDFLAKLTALANGNANAGGQTTTSTQPGTPLWQQLLGAGAVGAGIYGSVTR